MENRRINEQSREIIAELCNKFGPSGCESALTEAIIGHAAKYCDRYKIDRMGNLIFQKSLGKSENRLRIMLCAHTDEVGFMITEIRDDGLLCFDTLGGMDIGIMPSKRVMILARDGKIIYGTVASKAIHHKDKEERKKLPKRNALYIDIGAPDKETAEGLVEIGSFATFAPNFAFGGEDNCMMLGKALDDRLGCAVIIEIMRTLSENPPTVSGRGVDLFFCFNTREEVGLYGAQTVAFGVAPDIALVFEATTANDLFGVDEHKTVVKLGEGAALSIMDRRTVYDKALFERAREVAERKGIAVQIKRVVAGGNDSGAIHKSREGVKTIAISIPTRYLHSPCAMARVSDFEASAALGEALLRDIIAK